MLHFYFCSWGRHKHNIKFNEHEQFLSQSTFGCTWGKSPAKRKGTRFSTGHLSIHFLAATVSVGICLCAKKASEVFSICWEMEYISFSICNVKWDLCYYSFGKFCHLYHLCVALNWGFKWVVTAIKTSHYFFAGIWQSREKKEIN